LLADSAQGGSSGQKTEKPRIPYLFTASVTATYARKFSIETKVHSEIKVTMKSYPAPEAFLQAVCDHYKKPE
jgi:hypothetical protein